MELSKMRIDTKLNRDSYTRSQVFFLECWLNLCHNESLDSNRVTYSNVKSLIDELLELYKYDTLYNSESKREAIAKELHYQITNDVIIKSEEFKGIDTQLLYFFDPESIRSGKSKLETDKPLIISYCKQLVDIIDNYYLRLSFDKVRELIFSDLELDTKLKINILSITSNLISYLITKGNLLIECYNVYQHILTKADSSFESNYSSLYSIFDKPEEDYTVYIEIQNNKLFDFISEHNENEINFNQCVFFNSKRTANNVFVKISVQARTRFHARNIAEDIFSDSLDIVSYMLGKSDTIIKKNFKAVRSGEDHKDIRALKFEVDINNPFDKASSDEFNKFMTTISHMLSTHQSLEISNKIISSFRHYHYGSKSNTHEGKFISYWTSLEALTLGVSITKLAHDEHVIYSSLPCVILDYIYKKLKSFKKAIIVTKNTVFHVDGTEYDIEVMTIDEFYITLKKKIFHEDLISSLSDYPYLAFKLELFVESIERPYFLKKHLEAHKEKVCQQLGRIYRARNSIVHNAERVPRLYLLTANLDFYLRIVLNAMINICYQNNTISSPAESFARYKYLTESISSELDPSELLSNAQQKKNLVKKLENNEEQGKDDLLINWLRSHNH